MPETAAHDGKIIQGAETLRAMAGAMLEYRFSMDALITATRKMYMRAAIIEAGGHLQRAAALVGVHRNTVSRILTYEEIQHAVAAGRARKGAKTNGAHAG